ncbi:MAG: flagellar hook-length control protein FliK [Sandaracinaceae bacterium]
MKVEVRTPRGEGPREAKARAPEDGFADRLARARGHGVRRDGAPPAPRSSAPGEDDRWAERVPGELAGVADAPREVRRASAWRASAEVAADRSGDVAAARGDAAKAAGDGPGPEEAPLDAGGSRARKVDGQAGRAGGEAEASGGSGGADAGRPAPAEARPTARLAHGEPPEAGGDGEHPVEQPRARAGDEPRASGADRHGGPPARGQGGHAGAGHGERAGGGDGDRTGGGDGGPAARGHGDLAGRGDGDRTGGGDGDPKGAGYGDFPGRGDGDRAGGGDGDRAAGTHGDRPGGGHDESRPLSPSGAGPASTLLEQASSSPETPAGVPAGAAVPRDDAAMAPGAPPAQEPPAAGASRSAPDAATHDLGPIRWTLLRQAARGGHARVEVDHPTLGGVALELTLQDGALEVDVRAPSAVAAAALRREAQPLREALRLRGTRLSSWRVELAESAPSPRPPQPPLPRPDDGRRLLTEA